MLQLLICVDESLGRLDYATISDQARIELFIGDCNPALKHRIGIIDKKSRPTEYIDVCDWTHSECDEDGSVIELNLCFKTSHGPSVHRVNFSYIPPNVKKFSMKHIRCARDIILSDLPQSIQQFSVLKCTLPCDFQAHHLPRGLIRFFVGWNNFEGSCDLTVLPPNLEELSMHDNKLSGGIDMNHLPKTMELLDLSQNLLQGPCSILNLPEGIQMINLSRNELSGSCIITSVPESVFDLRLNGNNLEGTAILLKGINGWNCCVDLYSNLLTGLLDEKGRKHRWGRRILKRQKTNTSEKPRLARGSYHYYKE